MATLVLYQGYVIYQLENRGVKKGRQKGLPAGGKSPFCPDAYAAEGVAELFLVAGSLSGLQTCE